MSITFLGASLVVVRHEERQTQKQTRRETNSKTDTVDERERWVEDMQRCLKVLGWQEFWVILFCIKLKEEKNQSCINYRINEGPPRKGHDGLSQAVELLAAAQSWTQLSDCPKDNEIIWRHKI